jgi:atrial natriuretic peptide receptor A
MLWDCSVIAVQLTVPQVTCDISDANSTCKITAAVILPQDDSYEMSLSKVMPVLETARLFVMSNNWLPANVNLTFLPMDDRCSNVFSIFRALHAYSTCAHVFFGPTCEYALGECSSLPRTRP